MPLRQLYPDSASTSLGDTAKVEYAARPSTMTLLTVFSIIAVHGLNPRSKNDADHALDTWRTPTGREGRLWVRDDLPQYVPESRIFLYEYNSTAVYGEDRSTFIDKANEFLEAIRTERDDVETRPILLLGHSMGGLLIKQALINAHNNPKYTSTKNATTGLAFFATPHHGADRMFLTLGGPVAKIAIAAGFQKGDNVLETLKDGSIFSDIMQEHWRQQLLKYDIISFWGVLDNIVPRESARFGLPGDRENVVALNANHSSVCKFGPSQTDQDNFKLVRSNIQDLYKNALKIGQQEGRTIKRYFRLPSIGSPFFTGRTEELRRMRELLATANSSFQRRAVLWGVGGAGKTQLAIQYALKYEDEFSAVFYINARDEMSFQKGCFAIAKLLRLPEAESASVGDHGYTNALNAVVEAVKEWFIDHDGNWLLIVDSADYLESFDLDKSLPATKKGCIIITSQDSKAAGFGPGPSIEVGEMLAEDAQDLFMRRSGYLKPTQPQRDICLDIVAHLGYLALAVEHGAAYVQSMAMPLVKYFENLQRNLKNYLMHSPPGSLHRDTVQATLAMAFRAVSDRSKVALELLAFLAYIDNVAVLESHLLSPSALPAFGNWGLPTCREDLDKCKRIIFSFSLVRSQAGDDGDETLSMHSLVHRGIRLMFKVPTQWLLLLHSAAFISISTKGKPLSRAWFPSARLVLKLSTELFRQRDHGDPPEAIWLIIPSLIATYRVFWQIAGLMHELDELCNVTIQALTGYTSNNAKIVRFLVVNTRFMTIQFTGGPEAGLAMVSEFLIEIMTPAAATFMQQLHRVSDRADLFSEFRPYTLGEVFKDLSPPGWVDMLIATLQAVAIVYLGRREQLIIGTVYLRLSQLARTETWMTQARRLLGTRSPLSQLIASDAGHLDLAQCATVAAQHRAMGDMNSTITMFSQITESSKSLNGGWPGRFEMAVYDLAKLLLQLHRFEEARTVIQRLEYPSAEKTETSIARSYRDFYVWARKIYARSMTSHEQHPKVEAILKETYETTSKVFGKPSLSTLHAAYLLHQFYLLPCCLSTAKAGELRDEFNSGFEQMYCSRVRMRLGEGLYMGKILLSQGGVEEAVLVFEEFAINAERLWGPEDSMVERARKWEECARNERSVEIRDELAGRARLAWGCMTFPRGLNALGVE